VIEMYKYRAGIEVWVAALASGVLGLWMGGGAVRSIFSTSLHRSLSTSTSVAVVAVLTVLVGIALGCFFLYIAVSLSVARRRRSGLLQRVSFSKAHAVLTIDGSDTRITTNHELRKILENPEIIGKKAFLSVGAFGFTMLFQVERNR